MFGIIQRRLVWQLFTNDILWFTIHWNAAAYALFGLREATADRRKPIPNAIAAHADRVSVW